MPGKGYKRRPHFYIWKVYRPFHNNHPVQFRKTKAQARKLATHLSRISGGLMFNYTKRIVIDA